LIDFAPFERQKNFQSKRQNILTSLFTLTFVIIEENASDVPWNRWPVQCQFQLLKNVLRKSQGRKDTYNKMK
jgi:hypothetical protein